MEIWDMHDPETGRFTVQSGLVEIDSLVKGRVLCHHRFGIGVEVDEPIHTFAHAERAVVSDHAIDTFADLPRLGVPISGVVLGYSAEGMLLVSTRLSDIVAWVNRQAGNAS
ncbi:hypothetical protein ACTWPT_49165 [Nonomuraea sp. 3N208]|uniref:hypothetical protein n=1 Tax=Nonomuraea sp. 3N208 TaxID=3457421 RepID=UPI003FD687F4